MTYKVLIFDSNKINKYSSKHILIYIQIFINLNYITYLVCRVVSDFKFTKLNSKYQPMNQPSNQTAISKSKLTKKKVSDISNQISKIKINKSSFFFRNK
jgi:hypothetical protein